MTSGYTSHETVMLTSVRKLAVKGAHSGSESDTSVNKDYMIRNLTKISYVYYWKRKPF